LKRQHQALLNGIVSSLAAYVNRGRPKLTSTHFQEGEQARRGDARPCGDVDE
jgi:hypothetical protein